MPRPRIDLEPYKEEILGLLSENVTHTAICATLEVKYDITLTPRTLQRSLLVWRPPTNRHRDTITRTDYQDRVAELLPLYNTQEILQILASEGIPSSVRTLCRIRADLGITLRLSPEQRRQQFDDIEAILIAENVIGEVEDYSYRTLYRHLRSMGLFYTEYVL
jgi:hypothetical protein